MDQSIRFREATNGDRERVQSLVASCLAEFETDIDFDSSDADLIDLEETYSRAGGTFLLAVDGDDRLLGTVALKVLPE